MNKYDKPVMEWPKEERNQYCIEHGLDKELFMFSSMDAEERKYKHKITFLSVLLVFAFLSVLYWTFFIIGFKYYKDVIDISVFIIGFKVMLGIIATLFVTFIVWFIYDVLGGNWNG